MEKILKNIYQIINQYNNEIKQKYIIELGNKERKEFDYFHSDLEQQYLDYEVSIYKNIEKKELEFKEILDENNRTPYTLNQLESNMFRLHIGMYNNGKIQTIQQISKELNQPEDLVEKIIEETIKQLHQPYIQQIILEERNITDKEELIKKDISYLLMTDNLEQILRLFSINTIKDILNITKEQLYLINIYYGYDSELILPPTRIIKQLSNMGLKFKKPIYLRNLYIKYENERKSEINGSDIEEHTIYIKTKLDMLSAQQFEPELLKTLEKNERFQIDKLINEGYMQKQTLNAINQMIYERFLSRPSIKTINDIIKDKNRYLTQQEVDTIEKIIKKGFIINNNITEEEKNIEKTYKKEKN